MKMSPGAGARGAPLLVIAIFALLSCLPTAISLDEDCTYTIYTRTGSIWRGGTESTITVTLTDAKNASITIPNLAAWGGGLQGPNYTPFVRGALDAFSGLHYCLEYPICAINITSDGEGSGSGWYLNYLEVTGVGAHLPCNQKSFEVERWIAYDMYPFSLEYTQDDCDKDLLLHPIRPRRQVS